MINDPIEHPHREEILKWKKKLKLTDDQVRLIFEKTRFLSNEELYKNIDRFLRRKSGKPGTYFFDPNLVTVVTCAIYYLEIFDVKDFLDNIIGVRNTNRTRYSSMLAFVFANNPKYDFIHATKQGAPCPKIEYWQKKKPKNAGLF